MTMVSGATPPARNHSTNPPGSWTGDGYATCSVQYFELPARLGLLPSPTVTRTAGDSPRARTAARVARWFPSVRKTCMLFSKELAHVARARGLARKGSQASSFGGQAEEIVVLVQPVTAEARPTPRTDDCRHNVSATVGAV